jgi:N-acetylglucosamine malate deacetylase 1
MNRVILVVAAHPDDEILGCGATMARHVTEGDEVHIVLMGRGITSRQEDSVAQKALGEASRKAGEVVGARSLVVHDLPDNRMESVELLTLAKLVEGEIERVNPSTVYTHYPGDLNVDHVRVHEAVAVACRPMPGQGVRTLLLFEVPSSTDWRPAIVGGAFHPNWFVDVSGTLEAKLEALRAYAPEMRPFPHSRSLEAVEHLARWRGATVGMHAAEAFIVARNLVDL